MSLLFLRNKNKEPAQGYSNCHLNMNSITGKFDQLKAMGTGNEETYIF